LAQLADLVLLEQTYDEFPTLDEVANVLKKITFRKKGLSCARNKLGFQALSVFAKAGL
jgi:hypothetical protein